MRKVSSRKHLESDQEPHTLLNKGDTWTWKRKQTCKWRRKGPAAGWVSLGLICLPCASAVSSESCEAVVCQDMLGHPSWAVLAAGASPCRAEAPSCPEGLCLICFISLEAAAFPILHAGRCKHRTTSSSRALTPYKCDPRGLFYKSSGWVSGGSLLSCY